MRSKRGGDPKITLWRREPSRNWNKDWYRVGFSPKETTETAKGSSKLLVEVKAETYGRPKTMARKFF